MQPAEIACLIIYGSLEAMVWPTPQRPSWVSSPVILACPRMGDATPGELRSAHANIASKRLTIWQDKIESALALRMMMVPTLPFAHGSATTT
jgi:hypothetical protein